MKDKLESMIYGFVIFLGTLISDYIVYGGVNLSTILSISITSIIITYIFYRKDMI